MLVLCGPPSRTLLEAQESITEATKQARPYVERLLARSSPLAPRGSRGYTNRMNTILEAISRALTKAQINNRLEARPAPCLWRIYILPPPDGLTGHLLIEQYIFETEGTLELASIGRKFTSHCYLLSDPDSIPNLIRDIRQFQQDALDRRDNPG